MRSVLTLILAAAAAIASPVGELAKRSQPKGIDVSSYQPNVNWAKVKSSGVSFAFIKATEGTTYKSSTFSSQYTGATKAGLIRGAYHFARPSSSSGAAQAKYFLAHGGGWSADGITLPGVLDIEYGPSGHTCYDKSHSAMVAWIKDFSNTYHAHTKRYPSTSRNSSITRSASFASTNPLWIARYASSIGALPAGWKYTTFWQYANHGSNPGDQNVFNGDSAGLKRLAKGS
ncbi:glycoside hydrolase family 25 protein [Macrolepiota fuliginosa MF-IS2]|uniref:N,O-diacetylmuramidase n=1 Tax=Macrolepiota fuliginosa MF-IS2 TaxID=1400762 RepID=A0A9P5X220_9AGAR|nr:glycoside hydrolase family 25 protein [Macrolepiota fuliginosa MF-IS2]